VTRLELGPRDTTFAISYVALGFTSPSRNRYAVRLDGVDPKWVEAGDARIARYSGLRPGSYLFRVKAANNDGVWSETGAVLPITVRPPFWHSWWFRLAMLAVAAALLSLAYRLRVRHLLALERVRLRIASDLHDELGSDLSGIALAASRLESRAELAESDRDTLGEVRTTSLRVMEGLRDIVWVVNPEHDTVESMARRMRSVASRLFEDLVDYRFTTDLEAGSAHLDMATRRHLLLIAKELFHNVARHAHAASVRISLAARDGRLELEVADDGVGFDPTRDGDGSGLASIRRRAAEVGAELEVDSAPGRGARTRLVFEMTRRRQGAGRLRRGTLGR